MSLKIFENLEQGSPEWLQARCGILTASLVGDLFTPTGKRANNEKRRRLVFEILSQRLNQIVDETPQTFAMQRGHEDEFEAKLLYAKHFSPVTDVGFMTEDRWGVTLGYSPDGLVGDDGLIECKSRRHGLQIEVICSQEVPYEFMPQIQTGLLVSGRKWLDFISFPALGGGVMMIKRVYPDTEMQAAIIECALTLEGEITALRKRYDAALRNPELKFLETQRRSLDAEIFTHG